MRRQLAISVVLLPLRQMAVLRGILFRGAVEEEAGALAIEAKTGSHCGRARSASVQQQRT